MSDLAKTGIPEPEPEVFIRDFAYEALNQVAPTNTTNTQASLEPKPKPKPTSSTCPWCGKPAAECSGDCLQTLPISPLSTPRKGLKKHIKKPAFDLTMVTPHSPSSSPRAYSPPPAPEVQIAGPKSPAIIGEPGPIIPEFEDTAKLDQAATRRIRPGTKAADMASGPPLIPLSELDSPFQLQEHIKALHYEHTRSTTDPTAIVPLTHETAVIIATPPPNVDRSLWLYELTRFLTQHTNDLLVALLTKIDPACSAASCPEMRASEWQYLCAVHENPKACCAVDYCIHTLDWAGDVLTSIKLFPSRMTLGPPDSPGHQAAVRNITNIMRRVYRIFAHAWFQHREGVFWPVEGSGGIYTLFKTVCDVYGLIQEDNYTIPPEAEGLPSKAQIEHHRQDKGVMKKPGDDEGEEDATTLPIAGATTRRHKQTPSVGSAVGTITEGEEDESESPVKDKSGPLAQISNAAEKKDDSEAMSGKETAVQGGATEEQDKKKDEGDGAETVEGSDDGSDASSVVTAIHDDAEKEAENEA